MNHLIVMVKNPIPGSVKTRLQTRYTSEQAAAIYRVFVLDTLALTQKVAIDKRVIAYDPPDAKSAISDLCGPNWVYEPQTQGDLGERMHNALCHQLNQSATAAVLIGTDIPSLPLSYIEDAFDLLKTRDVVFGPSTDGGYYLVGISRPCPELFANIEWSTPKVFAQTVARLHPNGYKLGLLSSWFDVDTPEELDILISHADAQHIASGRDPIPHTRAYLSTLL